MQSEMLRERERRREIVTWRKRDAEEEIPKPGE